MSSPVAHGLSMKPFHQMRCYILCWSVVITWFDGKPTAGVADLYGKAGADLPAKQTGSVASKGWRRSHDAQSAGEQTIVSEAQP